MGGVPGRGMVCPFCKNTIPTSKFTTYWFLSPRTFKAHQVDGTVIEKGGDRSLLCLGTGRPVPTTSPWWRGLGRKKRR